MADYQLGPLSLQVPGDYTPRMLVVTAPEKKQPTGGLMVTKQAQSFAKNVTIAAEEVAAGTTADAYADAQLTAMKQGLPNFQLMKKGTVTVNAIACPLFEIQTTGPEGRLLQAITAYVVHGTTAYTLSASQLAGLPYQDARKEYLEIISSLTLAT